MDMVDQVLSIFAGTRGHLDDVKREEVADCEKGFRSSFRAAAARCRLNSAIAASSCRSLSASSSFVWSIFARSSGTWSRTNVRKPFSQSATSSRRASRSGSPSASHCRPGSRRWTR